MSSKLFQIKQSPQVLEDILEKVAKVKRTASLTRIAWSTLLISKTDISDLGLLQILSVWLVTVLRDKISLKFTSIFIYILT